jgi:hypothetical protein
VLEVIDDTEPTPELALVLNSGDSRKSELLHAMTVGRDGAYILVDIDADVDR